MISCSPEQRKQVLGKGARLKRAASVRENPSAYDGGQQHCFPPACPPVHPPPAALPLHSSSSGLLSTKGCEEDEEPDGSAAS